MDVIRRRGKDWGERLLALRDALGELYAAEGEALSRDLARWGKAFAVALLLLLAALALGFWLLALLVGVLVAVLAIWLPVWGATLVATGVVALIVGTLAWIGWRRLAALGGPLGRVKRRWRDHADWWRERVFEGPADEAPGRPEEPEDHRHAH
ncbi:MAG TPA: phage holin family protein [Thermoanaerobaculia bacterium]|nr:phage holin family protein [Thermoanaerobaculia bacterium]HXT50331.1 phage holin family protein [Thermoanaerobaculia bacterium]